MYKIGDILGQLLRDEGASGMDDLLKVKKGWAAAVGEPLASKTEPMRLGDNKLYIRSEAHVWSQEIHYEKERIKGAIEKETGVEIREVVLRKINLR